MTVGVSFEKVKTSTPIHTSIATISPPPYQLNWGSIVSFNRVGVSIGSFLVGVREMANRNEINAIE